MISFHLNNPLLNNRKFMINTGDIALYEPEIAVNTGNIIRLAAGIGATLHLIHPLGFTLNDKGLKRAGLDYHDLVIIQEHQSYSDFILSINMPVVAMTTKGSVNLFDFNFNEKYCLLFGPETRGLPYEVLEDSNLSGKIKIPQVKTHRSLNLSNAVAITAYEQARQLTYK